METAWETLSKEQLIEQNKGLTQQVSQLKTELEKFKFELAQIKRLIYGSKSERFVPAQPSEQLSLALGVEELPIEPVIEKITYSRQKNTRQEKPVRQPLPAHLPRKEIIIEPEGDLSGMRKIGEEITEELEYEPGRLYVNRYVRPKYVKDNEDGVMIGRLPSRPIEKGIPGPGLLAQIAVDKFVDHLPTYRQGKRYEREGVRFPVSTLGGWLAHVAALVGPLYDLQRKMLLGSRYVQADESPIKVLEKGKGKGKTHRGYMWVYHAPVERLVLFEYRPGRGGPNPRQFLNGYQGYLQVDGYDAYEWFDTQPGVDLVHCMAHARRKFDQALNNDKVRAGHALGEFGKLYKIEQEARQAGITHAQRQALRQEKAVPVLRDMGEWMKAEMHSQKVLPKSPIGKAIIYTLSRWDRLCLYAGNGMLEIDNNLVENAIRPLALGRKNYLFAGSHEAAQRIAMFYSFFGTCARNNVNPYLWLKKVLEMISDHPINKIEELLPANKTLFGS
jgi:transposase